MNTNLLNIVKQITSQYGEEVLADPRRLKAFFSDLAKDEPKPLRLAFGRCVEEGAYNALKSAADASERAGRKAAIAQRVRDEHGLDVALCGEALDILEAALFGEGEKAPPAAALATEPTTPQVSQPITAPEPVVQTQPVTASGPVQSSTQAAGGGVSATVEAVKKKHTLRNVLIAVSAMVTLVIIILVVKTIYRPLELDEYNNIFLKKIKNNDVSCKNQLSLTLRNVQNTQHFISDNFPDFNFEEEGYITDDYINELLIKSFNTTPEYAEIYLSGIEKMAGYSSVYAHLSTVNEDGNKELIYYDFAVDEEYSDCSGIEFFASAHRIFLGTYNSDGLCIVKRMYSDVNEYYWIITWAEDIPKNKKTELLASFLRQVRRAKVFQNIDTEWFKAIYTGIERNQQINNLVDW